MLIIAFVLFFIGCGYQGKKIKCDACLVEQVIREKQNEKCDQEKDPSCIKKMYSKEPPDWLF